MNMKSWCLFFKYQSKIKYTYYIVGIKILKCFRTPTSADFSGPWYEYLAASQFYLVLPLRPWKADCSFLLQNRSIKGGKTNQPNQTPFPYNEVLWVLRGKGWLFPPFKGSKFWKAQFCAVNKFLTTPPPPFLICRHTFKLAEPSHLLIL